MRTFTDKTKKACKIAETIHIQEVKITQDSLWNELTVGQLDMLKGRIKEMGFE